MYAFNLILRLRLGDKTYNDFLPSPMQSALMAVAMANDNHMGVVR